MLSVIKLRFFMNFFTCMRSIIKYYNVKLCCLFKKLMNVLSLANMFIIRKNTPSSSNIGALATNNYFRIVQNTYMCFVIVSFSLIFKVCNLCFKYIFVTTSYDSNNLINYVHAPCDFL